MKLYQCKSFNLLPEFAKDTFSESLCDVFDQYIQNAAHRFDALPCETTAHSASNCTDSELLQIANEIGIACYYPDLSRERRESLVVSSKTWTRYAGTSTAIKAMLNVLYDAHDVIIDDHLETQFRYNLNIISGSYESTEVSFKRFNQALSTIARASTEPQSVNFNYTVDLEQSVAPISGDCLRFVDTNEICEQPQIETIEALVRSGTQLVYSLANTQTIFTQTEGSL